METRYGVSRQRAVVSANYPFFRCSHPTSNLLRGEQKSTKKSANLAPKSIATRGGLIYSIVMNRTPGTAKFIAKLGTPTRGSNLFEIFR
jgi:hypothetical protein